MWGIVSEIITDTCNTLLHCEARNHLDFYCQTLSLLHDNIAVTVNLKDNPLRIIRAIPLAIHSIARPVDPNDDLPRVDIISSKKLKAEGTLEEIKTVLGWVINTRHLLISLPPDKHKKWSSDITKIIHSNKVSHTQLEPLIRRLNHVAGIIPMFRHFLGRLTQALYFSTKHKRTNLSIPELSDLHLSVKFLDMSAAEVSINNIVFQKPTSFYRSDSSEFGLGGYNIISGRAWRFEIPYHLCLCTSLNSLEFLACVTTIWIDFSENRISPEECTKRFLPNRELFDIYDSPYLNKMFKPTLESLSLAQELEPLSQLFLSQHETLANPIKDLINKNLFSNQNSRKKERKHPTTLRT
jgi:hypothetical protein